MKIHIPFITAAQARANAERIEEAEEERRAIRAQARMDFMRRTAAANDQQQRKAEEQQQQHFERSEWDAVFEFIARMRHDEEMRRIQQHRSRY